MEHNTNDKKCWCNPKLELMDDGSYLVIHKDLEGGFKNDANVIKAD